MNKIKEMVYSTAMTDSEVLYSERFEDGTGILVLNVRHEHPCGYITFPGIEKVKDCDSIFIETDEDDDWYDVHGGFTFYDRLHWPEAEDDFWLGWDYAHLGDYTTFGGMLNPDSTDKKWTTEEVIEEANKALEYIRKGSYSIYEDEE